MDYRPALELLLFTNRLFTPDHLLFIIQTTKSMEKNGAENTVMWMNHLCRQTRYTGQKKATAQWTEQYMIQLP